MSDKPTIAERSSNRLPATDDGKVPNAETRAAIEEARAIARERRAGFATAQELFDSLEGADGTQPKSDGE